MIRFYKKILQRRVVFQAWSRFLLYSLYYNKANNNIYIYINIYLYIYIYIISIYTYILSVGTRLPEQRQWPVQTKWGYAVYYYTLYTNI